MRSHTVAINNTCDLVIGGEEGESIIMSARSRNQFFDKRELLPDRIGVARVSCLASLLNPDPL